MPIGGPVKRAPCRFQPGPSRVRALCLSHRIDTIAADTNGIELLLFCFIEEGAACQGMRNG